MISLLTRETPYETSFIATPEGKASTRLSSLLAVTADLGRHGGEPALGHYQSLLCDQIGRFAQAVGLVTET